MRAGLYSNNCLTYKNYLGYPLQKYTKYKLRAQQQKQNYKTLQNLIQFNRKFTIQVVLITYN